MKSRLDPTNPGKLALRGRSQSLVAFEKGKLLVIPGWQYRMTVAAVRWFPTPILRRLSLAVSRVRRRRGSL